MWRSLSLVQPTILSTSKNVVIKPIFSSKSPVTNLFTRPTIKPLQYNASITAFALHSPLINSPRRFYAETTTTDVAPSSTADLFSQTFQKGDEIETKPKRGKGRRRAPNEAWGLLRRIKISTKKLNEVARTISGLTYKEAVEALEKSPKRVAKKVLALVHSVRYNAENNHNLNPEKLVVAECWTGRELFIKRIRFHAKGRSGLMRHPFSRINLILKEVDELPLRMPKSEIKFIRYKLKTGRLQESELESYVRNKSLRSQFRNKQDKSESTEKSPEQVSDKPTE